MKRPFGVIFSAILLLLGSLFQLLGAFLMALGGVLMQKQIASGGLHGATAAPPMAAWMPVFIYALSAFIVALSAWGILTTVGLFRLRRWARYSVLVIGGALALVGFVSLLSTLFMLAVPLPVPPTVDASQAQTAHVMTRVIFAVVALFYAFLCAVGVSWLVYFNLKRVRDVFVGATGEAPESRRPFPISVIAVFSMFGAGCCLLLVFVPFPAAIFGWILDGWGKVALYLVYAGLSAAVGIGLWRLQEWGRRLMLGLMVVGLANSVVYFVRPSFLVQYNAQMYRMMNLAQPQLPVESQTLLYRASSGFGVLILFAIGAVLIYYPGAFRPPVESPGSEPATLL